MGSLAGGSLLLPEHAVGAEPPPEPTSRERLSEDFLDSVREDVRAEIGARFAAVADQVEETPPGPDGGRGPAPSADVSAETASLAAAASRSSEASDDVAVEGFRQGTRETFTGGVVTTAGVSLAQRAGSPTRGELDLDLPEHDAVEVAYLYWTVVGTETDDTAKLEQPDGDLSDITGELIGTSAPTCGDDPEGDNTVYRADVTDQIDGSGTYAVSGISDEIYPVADAHGASLVVITSDSAADWTRTVHVNDGAMTLNEIGDVATHEFSEVLYPDDLKRVYVHMGVGDGQSVIEGAMSLDGDVVIPGDVADGQGYALHDGFFEGGAVTPASYEPFPGDRWDSQRLRLDDGFLPVAGPVTQSLHAAEELIYNWDCLAWTYSILEYQDGGLAYDPGVPREYTFGACRGQIVLWSECVTSSLSDPVNTATGSFTAHERDLAVPTGMLPLEFSRSYDSADTASGALGRGWHHPYEFSMRLTTDGAEVQTETGQRLDFTRVADGSLKPGRGVRADLSAWAEPTCSGAGCPSLQTYSLTMDDGSEVVFSPYYLTQGVPIPAPAREYVPIAVVDSSGFPTFLMYDAEGRLASVGLFAQSELDFSYTADGLLASATTIDGRTVSYGYDEGLLTSATDPSGATTTYNYNGDGLLETITNPIGDTQISNTYDARGRVVAQADATGAVSTFSYDDAAEAVTMVDAAGQSWTDDYSANVLESRSGPSGESLAITYDDDLNQTSVVDADGFAPTMSYDDGGNLLTRAFPEPLDYTESWTYDGFGNATSYTDGLGRTSTFTYRQVDSLLTGFMSGPSPQRSLIETSTAPDGSTTSYDYVGDFALESITDHLGRIRTLEYAFEAGTLNPTAVLSPLGETTTYDYDSAGRVISTVSPRGNEPGADPGDFRTSFTYDANGRLLSTTDPLGRTTAQEYDAAGRLLDSTDAAGETTSYEYNAAGEQIAEVAPNGARTESVFDDRGQLVETRTAEGHRTTYGYDGSGRLVSMVGPRGNEPGAEPDDYRTSYTYDSAGNLASETDQIGRTTTYTYDPLGRQTSMTDPLGRTSFDIYDAAGNRIQTVDAAGRSTTFEYDDRNRLVSTTAPGGRVTTNGYDAVGNVVATTSPTGDVTTYAYDDADRQVAVTDPRGNVDGADPVEFTSQFVYDADGNTTSTVDPLGNPRSTTYDAAGQVVAETDANGYTTSFDYDPLGRLTSVTEPGDVTVTFGYDTVGNRTSRTDADGNQWLSAFDLDRRLVGETSPDGSEWSYAYDADGNRVVTVDANANAAGDPALGTTLHTYDPTGRLLATDYSDDTPDVSYSYDDAGRRVSMTDGAGTETYTYDALDRPLETDRGGVGFAYTYNDSGDLTSRTYPDGTTIPYGYDEAGRVTSVGDGSSSTTYTYDPAGNVVETAFPQSNGHVETRTYDPAGRLLDIETMRDSTTLTRRLYTYDPAGNPLTVTNEDDETTTYEYDELDQLIATCENTTDCTDADEFIRYDYGPTGNRLAEQRPGGETTYSYSADGELLSQSGLNGDVTFGYDDNGQRVTAGDTSLSYDLEGRLAGLDDGTTGEGEAFTVTFDIRSLWIFPIYFGSVRVTDTQGSVITVPVWFGSAQATAEGATGSASFLGALDIDWTVADTNPDQIDITIGGTQEFSGSGTATSGDITVTKSGARLTRVAGTATVATTGTSGISYSYDGDGNRLATTDNADPTNDRRFTWDTNHPVPLLATETTSTDTALRSYTYGHGLVATTTPDDILYAHTDALGSLTHLSDAEGTEAGTFTYEPYGTPTTTGVAADHPIGFTGQYQDTTGYYNLRARTYDPRTGSFLTPDPLEAPESTTTTTPYTYATNQPTTHIDPTGMRGMPPGGPVFAQRDRLLQAPVGGDGAGSRNRCVHYQVGLLESFMRATLGAPCGFPLWSDGYTPRVLTNEKAAERMAVNSLGGCSQRALSTVAIGAVAGVFVGGKANDAFKTACQSHDYGYDILRFAKEDLGETAIIAGRRIVDSVWNDMMGRVCGKTRYVGVFNKSACQQARAVMYGGVSTWTEIEGDDLN